MRYLLDTHTLIWSQEDPGRLSDRVITALSDPLNDRFVSMVSIWEIGIKVALGKLPLAKAFRSWIDKALADLVCSVLPITLEHVERMGSLPFHHRDPFDRMLIAQALVENIPLLGADAQFDAYGINRAWSE